MAAGIGALAVLVVMFGLLAIRGQSDGSDSSSSSSSGVTPLGCPLPDTETRGGSNAWALCTEQEIAAMPFCAENLVGIEPTRQTTPGRGSTHVITAYRLGSGELVTFSVFTDPTTMYIGCPSAQRQLQEGDLRALSSEGGPERIPAVLAQ